MCIAVPMQIVEIDSSCTKARATYNGNEMEIDIRLISPVIGDNVLVHAGCALELIRKETADEILELFLDLKELAENVD